MTQCISLTRQGRRCRLTALENSNVCHIHVQQHQEGQQQAQQQQQQPPQPLPLRPFYTPLTIPDDAVFTLQDVTNLLSEDHAILNATLVKLRTFRNQKDAEYFVGAGLLPRILLLARHVDPILCNNALWILVNFTALPGEYSSLAILNLNGLPIVYACMMSPNDEVRENGLWCISNMSGSGKVVAEAMIGADCHLIPPPVLVSPLAPRDGRRKCARIFYNLSKYLNRSQALSVLQVISVMPTSNMVDKETMNHVLWGLAAFAKKFTTIGAFPLRVVIDHLQEGCETPALEIIACLSSTKEEEVVSSMVRSGIISILQKFLFKPGTSQSAAFALSNLACDVPDAFLAQRGLLFDILHNRENSECLWILCNLLSKLDSKGCTTLLQKGVFLRLVETLEESDPPLTIKQQNIVFEGIDQLFTKVPLLAIQHARILGVGEILHKHRDKSDLVKKLLDLYETESRAHIGIDD